MEGTQPLPHMSEPPTVRAAIISPTTHPCAPRPCRHALEEMDYKGGATTLLLATPLRVSKSTTSGKRSCCLVTLLKCSVRLAHATAAALTPIAYTTSIRIEPLPATLLRLALALSHYTYSATPTTRGRLRLHVAVRLNRLGCNPIASCGLL